MSLIPNLAIVALGGAIGSCLRYSIGLVETFNTTKGLSTFLVNVLGCFIIGCLYSIFQKWEAAEQWRLLLFVGLLGGFTTFSSYALDAITMLRDGENLKAVTYIVATNIGGLFAAAAGIFATSKLLQQ